MDQEPSYWENVYYSRHEFTPIWSTGYQEAIQMIKEAAQGERNDELFYTELIHLAPSQEQVAIIESIRNDERGHNKMFSTSNEQYEKVNSYTEGLQRALMGELSVVERYRKIWFGLPAGIYKDTVVAAILKGESQESVLMLRKTHNRTCT